MPASDTPGVYLLLIIGRRGDLGDASVYEGFIATVLPGQVWACLCSRPPSLEQHLQVPFSVQKVLQIFLASGVDNQLTVYCAW